jgi:selenide,water dikinase
MKRLLLIGGGHSHLFVLEALRLLPPSQRENLAVTLVSRELKTPYSGMLPGLVAGHYEASKIHIDLHPLAQAAGVTLEQARIAAFDPAGKSAWSDDGRRWDFDLASIGIGSVPPVWQVPGAAAHALAVKPVDTFLDGWRSIEAQVASRPDMRIAVAGGGAGGIEMALAMAHRLQASGKRMQGTLLHRGRLLPGHPLRAARLALRHLQRHGIAVLGNAEVSRVEEGRLHLADGNSIPFDALIWATGAGAQSWLSASGLACRDGFVLVNSQLQSLSHPHVFAAGDAASHEGAAWPKSGVIAVRQGPLLAENLLRSICEQPLLSYHAQRSYLALISTGGRHAIASWHNIAWEGDWVWRWKDAIDRRFMRRFSPSACVTSRGQMA